MAGFSANPRSELPAVATRTPVVQPASVQFIPRAYYSPEARSVGITGQVVLRLRLRSDRKVDVLEVVQGLGYGVPVDSVHTLTVDFELSN
jgi:hypothetical protein